MALAEKVNNALGKLKAPLDKPPHLAQVEEKLKRGRDRLTQLGPRRREAIAFANNEHYVSVGKEGKSLTRLDTVPMAQGGQKPDHRVRLSRDLIGPVVKAKVSAATQRVPSYEPLATSPDQEDFSASRLAMKIAAGGYDLWRLKRANKKLVWNALVTEEGFIRPYWDSTVGPYVKVDEEGPEGEIMNSSYVAMGEVGVRVYSGLEVAWEPGVDFEESSWYSIEHTRPVEDVEREAGFIGIKLSADAEGSDSTSTKDRRGPKLVLVTEYLERPCPDYPEGRRLIFANEKVIFPEEPYPLRDAKGNVVDEPCLHRLSYDIDASSDRDKGLVSSLIESMRQYDQAGNKILEWVQHMLAPQWEAEEGSLLTPITDEPGAVVEYSPLAGGNPPKPRQMPQVPRELFELQDRAQAELGFISHSNEVPSQVESGKAVATLAQKDALAWQDFIEDYAELQGRLMRDCLTLVQLHYTEDRLVNFRGRTGWESVADFKGADLRGQTDVRVQPSSLEPRTRATNEQRIMNIAQMFPGHFPPEVLISALEGGSAEKLIEGYEDDVARANRIISLIRSGQFWSIPKRPAFPGEEAPLIHPATGEPVIDPNTGEFIMETELPGWMPRPFDNIPVQKSVLTTWMKTDDWAQLDEASQRATMDVYDACLQIEAKDAQRAQELQSQMAVEAGMQNAARPGPEGSKPMPSLPALEQGGGEEEIG